MFSKLDFAKNTGKTLEVEDSMITHVLQNSFGEPTMSNEDVKLAVLSLYNTCKVQQEYIDELVNCVNELRAPKKKFRRRKK